MPSAYIIKESSSCHAKTGLLVKGIDSPLKGTQKLCTVMKTGRNFPAKGLSMTVFNKLALDVLHHIFTPQQTRSPQNVSAEWTDFTSSSILHGHLLAAPFIVVFSWRKVHFHIKWQDSSFRGWKCLWRALRWGCTKQNRNPKPDYEYRTEQRNYHAFQLKFKKSGLSLVNVLLEYIVGPSYFF